MLALISERDALFAAKRAPGDNGLTPMWSRESWRKYPALQQPAYPNEAALQNVLSQLRQSPALVYKGEVEHLKTLLAEAAQGKRFLLQGGDCAERFHERAAAEVRKQLRILLQMSWVLRHGLNVPIICLGRMAGQFAKPRSAEFDLIEGKKLPVYRGDLINSFEPEAQARVPDPERMLQGYAQAAAALKHMRAFATSGAEAQRLEHWDWESFPRNDRTREYLRLLARMQEEPRGRMRRDACHAARFFASHEALLLGYEEALTRRDPESERCYNFGAHLLWLGDRTRRLHGAHVEYLRGLANPLGVKIGPECEPEELPALLRVLNPLNEWGRITLITRLGADNVARLLPRFIKAVQQSRARVLWCCDPMHANTLTTQAGWKTRRFEDILAELRLCFELHRTHGSWLGGVHFELTGDNVTECLGGAQELAESDLARNYETYCDPRLNYVQSLEMAFEIVSAHQAARFVEEEGGVQRVESYASM